MGIFDDDFMVPEPSPEEGQEGGTQAPEGEPASKEDGVAEPETKPEDATQKPEQEPKEELILGKFKDVEALTTGYVNLMNRIGEQYDLEQFENLEQLEEAYKAAERQLGGQKQQPQANAEVEQLKQQLAMTQYQIQQMAQYFQTAQQQQQQQMQPQQQQQMQPQAVDPATFLDQLYEKGPEAITPLIQQVVNAELQRAGRDLGAQMGQYLAPVYQKMQVEEVHANWSNQAERMMSEVEDFDEYRDEMMELFENPQTAPELVALTQSSPNGIYMALRAAYDRAKVNRLSQDGQAFQSAIKKHAARLGGSGGRMTGVKQTPEEVIKQQIFGGTQEGGIFG